MRVYEKLFGATNIYDGVNPDDLPNDLHGWNEVPEVQDLNIDPKLIVEVGTWKGASAIKWAKKFPESEVICIDTWLGSEEMWMEHRDQARYGSLLLKNGYPSIYRTFLGNVVREGVAGQITPMPMTSAMGLNLLMEWDFRPDIIYVDAGHDYNSVKMDIMKSLCLFPKIICGDDYQPGWPGVVQAVDEFLPHAKKEGVFWYYVRR